MCICHMSLILCNRVNSVVANNRWCVLERSARERFVSERCCEKCCASDTFKGTLQIMQYRADTPRGNISDRKYFFVRPDEGRKSATDCHA